MAIATFGVTADSVRAHFFPHMDAWTTASRPSTTSVTELINAEAGRLQGRLLKESITAATIDAAPSSAAYAMCADVLRKMVAVRLSRTLPGAATELAKAWAGEVDEWLKMLEADGGTFLGDDTLSTSASDPDGPTSYLDEYGIDTGDTADASSAAPVLRRDDIL